MINTHILALRWGLSVGTGSLHKVVAEDKVDIFGFKLKVTRMLFFIWSARESSKLLQFSDSEINAINNSQCNYCNFRKLTMLQSIEDTDGNIKI